MAPLPVERLLYRRMAPLPVLDPHPHFIPVGPNLRHVHGAADGRQSVERPGRFGAEVVPDLPVSLGQTVDEQGHLLVPKLLVDPHGPPGVVTRLPRFGWVHTKRG